jgi:hypothetical protein
VAPTYESLKIAATGRWTGSPIAYFGVFMTALNTLCEALEHTLHLHLLLHVLISYVQCPVEDRDFDCTERFATDACAVPDNVAHNCTTGFLEATVFLVTDVTC